MRYNTDGLRNGRSCLRRAEHFEQLYLPRVIDRVAGDAEQYVKLLTLAVPLTRAVIYPSARIRAPTLGSTDFVVVMVSSRVQVRPRLRTCPRPLMFDYDIRGYEASSWEKLLLTWTGRWPGALRAGPREGRRADSWPRGTGGPSRM